MKLTSRKIVEIDKLLRRYSTQSRGPSFVHMVARNLLQLKPFVTVLDEQAAKQSKEFKEYDSKRLDVCKSMADKGANGDALMNVTQQGVPISYKIIARKEEFDKEVEELRNQYDKVIEEEETRKEEYEEFLDSEEGEEEITFRVIPFSSVPKVKGAPVDDDVELVVSPIDLMSFFEFGIIRDDLEGAASVQELYPANDKKNKKDKKKAKAKKKR